MKANFEFSNYNAIETEKRFNFRKIYKLKFILFVIFLILLLMFLIILFIHKNRQYNKKKIELSEIKNEIIEVNSEISNKNNQTKEAESNLNSLINELSITKEEKDKIKNETLILEIETNNLKRKKNQLLGNEDYLTNQLNYKMKSLNEEELKIEINEMEKLLEKIKQRFADLSINNSNIIKKGENINFETFTDTEILSKCYDSEVYGFHVNRFHDNCDGYPLLILIKTKDGERIGAFTSKSNDGIKNITDEKSVLINFDKNKFFLKNVNKKCYVYCDIDQFPSFGNDLIIYRDGHGESKFSECYNIFENISKNNFSNKESFAIEIMEIYAVKLNGKI